MDASISHILTINGGSSSVKFAVFTTHTHERVLDGKIDHIGMEGTSISVRSKNSETTSTELIDTKDPSISLTEILKANIDLQSLIAVGHRVVHGGNAYQMPIRITEDVLSDLESFAMFAPRHLPAEITLIRSFMKLLPAVPHIACFDTSFFKDLPRLAKLLPIPKRYEEKGVRRYGFHGLSYEYLMQELKETLKVNVAEKKIILAHLGAGASLAAVPHEKPVETTMGFTPNSGTPMATRTGDIDPGFYEYCVHGEGMTPEAFGHMVNYESGYLGVSGSTADMETLIQKAPHDAHAEEAVAFFCHHIKKHIGALTATMNGLDIIVFSGGMGEHAPEIRRRICEGLSFLGIEVDHVANSTNEICISAGESQVILYVIPTNEELTIARQVSNMLS